MTWIPEIITIFLAVAILFKLAFSKGVKMPFKYLLLIAAYLLHIISGFLLNDVSGGVVLAGIRIYTKFIPIFLVPLVFPLSHKAFRNLLIWVYGLSMLQFPVVLFQRYVMFKFSESPDRLGGTLGWGTSGVLALYLITVISFLISFYYKQKISFRFFFFSAVAAFIPITMNSTKISVVLLPIAFVVPAVFIAEKRDVIFKTLLFISLLLGSLVVYKLGYDYYAELQGRRNLTEYVTNEAVLNRYNQVRLKPLEAAIKVAPKGDLRFAIFGRGAGNVSKGFLPFLTGKYFLTQGTFYDVYMTFPKLMWEIGILGTLLFFLFPVFVFFDAIKASKSEGVSGAYGLGMLTFTIFIMLSTIYTYTIDSNILIFLYFFAAGQTVRLSVESEQEASQEIRPVFSTA